MNICERKKSAQRFLKFHFKGDCPHMFDENLALTAKTSKCFVCKRACVINKQRPDILSAGLPCQPFSKARRQNGATPKTGSPETHPLWGTSMVEFCETLKARAPHVFIVEEVLGFAQPCEHLLGLSPAKALAKMVKKLGYGITAVELDHAMFVNMSRPRCWLIGVSAGSGGQEGADWIGRQISLVAQEVEKFKKLKPINVFDVVDINDAAEIERRPHGAKALLN